ncbi:methyltransferase [Thiolapillus brandeum]|uniref:Ribosomal RNA large subunit methyltransferase G n=1 Tax=Thiolapillus brandeum TaxID=1076588 RepID=A0A7U6GG43_9GAMM|nr:methyltransferase [Thiolapillus brandeum]BAO42986.1 ribosomal RNA small subunit methyltransferase C [Thiolapillus brandeum]
MTETSFDTPFGRYTLQRLPIRPRDNLRAWDAADEYLLKHLADTGMPGRRMLILNDSFGALTLALHQYQPWSGSDSALAQAATRNNARTNGIPRENLHLITSLEQPALPLELVLIKAPKTLALLEYQLIRLRAWLTPDARVLLAGMMKVLPSSVWKLLESLIGPTSTFPGRKKAKLIEARFDPNLALPPRSRAYPQSYVLEGSGCRIFNHANVFSREKLDIGSRFFLEHLPMGQGPETVLDLGCGNGVLALMTLKQNPQAVVHCVDESHMATASARATLEAAFGPEMQAEFHTAWNLDGFPSGCIDRVLCNPPFHQQHAVGDHIARDMFQDAKRVLRQGGELWVVGNRHLGYHQRLKRLFGNTELMASNPKFVVLRSIRKANRRP